MSAGEFQTNRRQQKESNRAGIKIISLYHGRHDRSAQRAFDFPGDVVVVCACVEKSRPFTQYKSCSAFVCVCGQADYCDGAICKRRV